MTPKTIGRFGPARGGVRVYEDAHRQLVTVFWRAHGRRFKRSWPLTTAGRKEAKVFAKAMVEEWATGGNRAPLSTRALWDLYIAAQVHLRARSTTLYASRWAKWQLFVGAGFLAEQANGLTMAEFTAALRKVGHAVNQIAEHVKMVKIVYAWGRAQRALAHNDLAGYRFKRGKDEPKNEPGEYRAEEFELLLAELDPRSSRTWRAHAVLQFIGAQGVRINAALNLRWTDVAGDRVEWPVSTDKTGRKWAQPLRLAAWAAIETARYWRARDGYVGDFVFYSSHRQTARGDQHYKVQAFWQMLRNAEDQAEVPHRPWRAAHGFRRMVTGDLWEEFKGDLKLVMDFTGHTDLRSFQKYLKQRDDRLAAAIAAADARERDPESGTQEAPELAGVGVSDWEERATGRNRTDDREHPTSPDGSATPSSVAPSRAEGPSPRSSARGKSHPKPAPKRHPRRGGSR
jgi:integrase